MKSEEARKKAEKECQRQVLQAFLATEAMRVEAQKREQQLRLQSSLKLIRDSLTVLETQLSPLLNVLESSNDKLQTNAIVIFITKNSNHLVSITEMLFSNKNESFLADLDPLDSNLGQVRMNAIKLSSQCPVSQDSL